MTPHAALRRAVDLAEGQSALAERVAKLTNRKIYQSHVSYWLNGMKRCPAQYAIAIERAVNGRITRAQLRPDIYPADTRP